MIKFENKSRKILFRFSSVLINHRQTSSVKVEIYYVNFLPVEIFIVAIYLNDVGQTAE